MVSKALIVLCAVAAVVLATEETKEKPKRAVVVGAYPYAAAGAYPYAAAAYPAYAAAPIAAAYPAAYGYKAYDDGKYYPGKYEHPTMYHAAYPGAYY